MGIEPFLLSSSLLAVMAQRLVRLLCVHCRESYTADEPTCELLRVDPLQSPQLFRPAGCPHCNNTGYRGRTGIYEFIEIDDTLRSLIHERASEQAMTVYARTRSAGIGDDGRRRIIAGETTVEEVLRVTSA
jgi:general secretion pathway protein E